MNVNHALVSLVLIHQGNHIHFILLPDYLSPNVLFLLSFINDMFADSMGVVVDGYVYP